MILRTTILLVALFAAPVLLQAQPRFSGGNTPASSGSGDSSVTRTEQSSFVRPADQNYKLRQRDQMQVTVFGEPDLTVVQRVDADGQLRVPLLGNVPIKGRTIRNAEEYIEEQYVEQRYLRDPMVTITITDYAPQEISVLGQVRRPGIIVLPVEQERMDIVELITQAGGFTEIAKADNVRVTRPVRGGQDQIFYVNVEKMITGRGARDNNIEQFYVYPEDRLWVEERYF